MIDLSALRNANLAPRERDVPVPDLGVFFPEGEEPIWRVRGLTGEEIARANEASQRHTLIGHAVEALASAAAKEEQVDALRTLIGYGRSVPDDMAKRLDHLVAGSVAPTIDRELAVRLFQGFPIVAYKLTNVILELTGLGPDLGKLPPSTPTPESA